MNALRKVLQTVSSTKCKARHYCTLAHQFCDTCKLTIIREQLCFLSEHRRNILTPSFIERITKADKPFSGSRVRKLTSRCRCQVLNCMIGESYGKQNRLNGIIHNRNTWLVQLLSHGTLVWLQETCKEV